MGIKDLPERERPQEKLMYSGPESLSTAELLALLLRNGTANRSAVQLAEDILAYVEREIGNMRDVSVHELCNLDGIGKAKACSVVACMELTKRFQNRREDVVKDVLRNPDSVANLLMEDMRGLKQEQVVEVLLNSRCEVQSKIVVSKGSLNSAPMQPSDVLRGAIRNGAAGIILAHNHPSGDPTPSKEDIQVTRRMQEAGKLVGIQILDHLIIGNGKYISLRTEGYME